MNDKSYHKNKPYHCHFVTKTGIQSLLCDLSLVLQVNPTK